jgi:hypothetical protein
MSEKVRRQLFVVDVLVILGQFPKLSVNPGPHVSLQGGGARECRANGAAIEQTNIESDGFGVGASRGRWHWL